MRPDRSEALLAGLLLAGTGALVLLPLAQGGAVYYRDLSQNLLPLRTLAASLRAGGESLGWNPYLGGGTPLAADPNSLLLHPAWALDRLLPAAAAIKATTALHLLLAGAFLAAFLRRRGLAAGSASAGAAVLVLSGPFLSLTTLPNLLAAAAWIPPAAYFLDRARSALGAGPDPHGGLRGAALWSLPAAVACGAASLMPADPALAAALAVMALVACAPPIPEAPPGERPCGPAPRPSRPPRRSVLRSGPALAAYFLILSLMAASMQLLPAWNLVRSSERAGGLSAGELGKWSLHPGRLVELVVPGWLGDPTSFSPDRHWGAAWVETGFPFLLSIYVGLPAVALVCAGALRRDGLRRVEKRAGMALALVGLALAFGKHIPGFDPLWRALPGLGMARYPERLLLPCLMGASLLAALGAERLSGSAGQGRAQGRLAAVMIALGVLLAGSAFSLPGLGTSPAALAGGAILGRDLDAAATSRLGRGLFHGGAAGFACAAILLRRRAGLSGPATRIWLTGLVCADLAIAGIAPARSGWLPYALSMNPTAPAELLSAAPFPLILGGETAGAPEGWRTFRAERPEGFQFRSPDDRIVWGFLWDRMTLARSWPAAFEAPTAFDAPTDRLARREVVRAAAIAADGSLEQRLRVWSLDSVRFITTYESLQHPNLVLAGRLEGRSRPPLARYVNEAALPRARVVGRAVRASGPAEALRLALDEGFDPALCVVLEDPAGAPEGGPAPVASRPIATDEAPGPSGEARVRRLGASEILLTAKASAPSFLVLAENFDQGWRALLDGKPARTLRAYGFLTALPVGPGEHRIVLSYRSPLAAVARVASGLALVLSATAAFWLRRTRIEGKLE